MEAPSKRSYRECATASTPDDDDAGRWNLNQEAMSSIDPRWITWATWGFVALGVATRTCRYFLRFPLWCDEAYVAVNFADRGFGELAAPLDFGQVCPLLFLWGELAVVKVFGFTEWSLRLLPYLAGVGSVFVFHHVAARLLRGVALLTAMAVFGVAYYPIRHAVEVKPYSFDLLVALVLMALVVRWWQRSDQTRWLWAMAVLTPIALGLSYPAVFVAGAASLVVFVELVRSARARGARLHEWAAFATFNVALVSSFLGWFLVVTAAQYESSVEVARTTEFWRDRFPPLTQPGQLLVWLLDTHVGRMMAYPIGGEHGGSVITFLCVCGGVVVLLKRRQRKLLALLLMPFALNLVAAALERYPYGGSARVAQHLAPAICLLAGMGAAAWMARARDPEVQRKRLVFTLAGLVIFGVGFMVRDLVHPYKTEYDARIRDVARCIWTSDAITVCLGQDLDEDFAVDAMNATQVAEAQYLANRRIYGEAVSSGVDGPLLAKVSADRPLRCVTFSLPDLPRDREAVAEWLERMQRRYDWTGYVAHDVPSYYRRDLGGKERFEIYEFVPKSTESPAVAADWRVHLSLEPVGGAAIDVARPDVTGGVLSHRPAADPALDR